MRAHVPSCLCATFLFSFRWWPLVASCLAFFPLCCYVFLFYRSWPPFPTFPAFPQDSQAIAKLLRHTSMLPTMLAHYGHPQNICLFHCSLLPRLYARLSSNSPSLNDQSRTLRLQQLFLPAGQHVPHPASIVQEALPILTSPVIKLA